MPIRSHNARSFDSSRPYVSVATEVWIATALLHFEQPQRPAFGVSEISERARAEGLVAPLRPGVTAYAYGHAVANKRPSPNTLRLLYEPQPGLRRLFRATDQAHPARHGRVTPALEELPPRYRDLLSWYEREYSRPPKASHQSTLNQSLSELVDPAPTRLATTRTVREQDPPIRGSSVGELLVVTSCTSDKLFKVPHALTQSDFLDPARLAHREAELDAYRAPAGAMYQGEQHLRVMEGVQILRDHGIKVDLTVISAGYGVISEDRKIVPYDVTFSTMSQLQIRSWANFLNIPAAIRGAVAVYPLLVFLLGDKYLTAIDPPIHSVGEQQIFFFARPAEDRLGGNGVHHIHAGSAQLRDYPGASGISLKGHMFVALARAIAADPESTLGRLKGSCSHAAMAAALRACRRGAH